MRACVCVVYENAGALVGAPVVARLERVGCGVAPAVGRSRGREVIREGGQEGGRREEGTEMPHLNSDLLGSRLIVDTPSHLDVCLLP